MIVENLNIRHDMKIREKSQEITKAIAIIDKIGIVSCLKKKEIISKSRNKKVLAPRQLAMYLIRINTKLSLNEIGVIFNRNHAAVINSINKVSEQLHTKTSIYRELYIKLGLLDEIKLKSDDILKYVEKQSDIISLQRKLHSLYFIGFCAGNVEKYLRRFMSLDTVKGANSDDINKALQYIARLNEFHNTETLELTVNYINNSQYQMAFDAILEYQKEELLKFFL